MTSLAIIPARGGSKRIPHKNVQVVGGKPLVAWTIEAAKRAAVDRIVVATDDDEIAEIARRYEAEVLRRPPDLAGDNTDQTLLTGWIYSVIGYDWDKCLRLNPTSPLRGAAPIFDALDLLDNAPTVVSVCSSPLSYFAGDVIHDGRFMRFHEDRPRTQDVDIYTENGAIFGWTRRCWELTGEWTSRLPAALIMSREDSIDVNEPIDLEIADFLLRKRYS